jgi:hypothetical protein
MLMQRTTITLALLGLLAVLQAPGADGVRIAILAGEGERAPKVGVVDRLMAELSKRPEVVILERERIRNILAEQQLGLSGLADRAQAVKTGRILGADLLLAVERIGREQDKARRYRVKGIEAQTGLTVGDRFFDGPAVEQEPGLMAEVMERSLAWLRTPAGRRRCVAVMGYSAEQRQASLSDLPVALGALVESRIAQATNVLVVDREYLRRLRDEQDLTGVERQLALSSYLVEGLIRPSATDAGRVDVQTRVHPLHGTDAHPVLQSQGSVSNVSAMAHDVAAAILRQIDADPLPPDATPAAQEAARLLSHAQTLQRYGETARSLPLLESSYVLDPKPGTALLLAETIKGQAMQRAGTTNALAEVEKQELLTSFLRAMRLWQVEMDQRIADSRGKTVPFLPAKVASAVHVLGPLWPRLRSEDPETSHLYRELRQQKEACRQREIEYSRELWPKFRYGKNRIPGSTGYYDNYVRHEVGEVREMSEDASEYVAQMKQLMAPWLEMPGYTSSYVLGLLMLKVENSISGRVRSEADAKEMLALCDWISSQPSPLFEFTARYFKTQLFRAGYIAKIYKESDLPWCAAVFREMVALYPTLLTRYGNDYWVNLMITHAMFHPNRVDPAEQLILNRKQLDAVVTSLDRRSFAQWLNANWGTPTGTAKGKLKSFGEDDQRRWLEAALARLPPPHLAQYRNEIVQAGIDAAHKEIGRSLFALCQGGSEPPKENSPYWQAYRVEPVELGTAQKPGGQLRICKRVGDRLALVWATPQGDGLRSFLAEVCNLDGRPLHSFPPFTQSAVAASNAPVELRDVTLDGEQVFVAAGAAGLLVFSRPNARLLGVTEGLPRAPLAAVATVGGKVVMGFDSDYLGAFDPRSGQFEEIAFSRSLLKRNPLDGCRQRFSVRAMAADRERACVWITTRQPDGVWRLSLPDGALAPVGNQFFENLSVDDGALLGAWRGGLVSYNPATARWAPIPLYGQPGPYLEPRHVRLGRDIVSAGTAGSGAVVSGGNSFVFRGQKGLYLHKRVARDAFHLPLEAGGKPAHIGFLIKTSDRTALAGTIEGAFWRLTRPEGAAPEEEAVDKEQQVLDAFIAAQTNRVAARALAASSTADAEHAATNLCDGINGTCWAAATNDVRGAWVEIELERPTRLSSLRLVNGWIPDEKWRTHYPVNHRVQRLDVTTDTGEKALFDVEDHNDPQYLRPVFRKPVRRLRFTVVEIHESEVVDFEDPPWLNLSEITFFESREGMR